MWNIPSKERLDRIPRLYSTESIPLKDKISPSISFWLGVIGTSLNTMEMICFSVMPFSTEIMFVQRLNALEDKWGVKKISDIPQIKVWDTL